MIRLAPGAIAAVLLLVATPLAAHEDYMTTGVITKRYADADKEEMMDVRSAGKSTVTLWVSKLVKVIQGKKTLTMAALKVGTPVIVRSTGDELDHSKVFLVEIQSAK